MSVSIGLLTENFSIIAADDRGTYPEPRDGKKYEDGCEKIFLTKFGWVAQHGGIYLTLKFFQRFFETHEIKTRRHIYTGFLLASKETDKYAKPIRSCTTTYLYSINYFKGGVINMGIEILDFEYKHRKLKSKNVLIVQPPKETKRIKALIERYADMVKAAQDIHQAIYLIACFMHELSKLSQLVSNNVTCGISYRLSDTEVIMMKVSENAKKIKQLYEKKQNLSEVMFVFDNTNL